MNKAEFVADVSERIADNAMMSLAPDGPAKRRLVLKAGKRETVASVARRYRVQRAQVAQWNDVSTSARFRPGQRVIVYVSAKSKSTASSRARSTRKAAAPRASRPVAIAKPALPKSAKLKARSR